jgi:hypothetical protein
MYTLDALRLLGLVVRSSGESIFSLASRKGNEEYKHTATILLLPVSG